MEDILNKLLIEINDLKYKQSELLSKLDLLVSMNNDLINANLKSFGIKTTIDNKSPVGGKKNEELYYGIDTNSFYIYGSTYDVKDKIKSLGGKWDKSNSRWVVCDCEENDINKLFPEIIKKQNSNKCLIDD